MIHSLYSHDQEMPIAFFQTFNREAIKETIISHLNKFPEDTLEHCKEFNKVDIRKYYGNEILNFYKVNPKNNKVSLIVTRGNKEYLKSIQ